MNDSLLHIEGFPCIERREGFVFGGWLRTKCEVQHWMSRVEVDGSKVIGSLAYNPKEYPIYK